MYIFLKKVLLHFLSARIVDTLLTVMLSNALSHLTFSSFFHHWKKREIEHLEDDIKYLRDFIPLVKTVKKEKSTIIPIYELSFRSPACFIFERISSLFQIISREQTRLTALKLRTKNFANKKKTFFEYYRKRKIFSQRTFIQTLLHCFDEKIRTREYSTPGPERL